MLPENTIFARENHSTKDSWDYSSLFILFNNIQFNGSHCVVSEVNIIDKLNTN